MSEARPPHILIVEDHASTRRLLVDMVRRDFAPAILYEASTVQGAERILKEFPIDIMLLDVGLPDTIGYQGNIRALVRAAPLVATAVISGVGTQADAVHAYEDGARAYYDKDHLLSEWQRNQTLQRLLGEVRHSERGHA